MKRLYLMRHAKSSWKDHSLPDFDRPLNKRGKRDAPFMGKYLKTLNVKPDLITSSTAKRARKTAKLIANELDYPLKKIDKNYSIYSENVQGLLKLIQYIDDCYNQVMIIGHNPDLTELAEILSNNNIGNIPTCGIVCIDFNRNSWKDIKKGQGSLIFFEYPKKLGMES